VLTVTSRNLLFKIEDEYRAVEHDLSAKIKNSFILEPFGRNAAPAIATAALQTAETHGETLFF
jgi:mannose-1-phosphate guanylyltransferase/mannose-6-phosphate isomerase